MKMKHTAARPIWNLTALVAVLAMELWLGATVVARIGQTTGVRTDTPPVWNVNISDLMSGGR